MKAITQLVTKVEGDTITITGKLMDANFPLIVGQRQTIHHHVAGNRSKPRRIENNTHGVCVLRSGSDGVLIPKDELVSVMLEIDSKLTDAPFFEAHPNANSITGKIKSEIPLTAKIQQSDDGKTWADVPNADKDFKPESGKHYRCVASNKTGETASNSFQVPKAK
jgi:hypothetical protein